MNKIIGVLLAVALYSLPSCNVGQENDGKTVIIQDSLIKVFPTWQALKIKVEDNRTRMDVIIGDATFYKASAAQKAAKAEELGKMIVRIYGKDCYLEKGNLIVTSDVHNQSETPADGISTPIDFAKLKQAAK